MALQHRLQFTIGGLDTHDHIANGGIDRFDICG